MKADKRLVLLFSLAACVACGQMARAWAWSNGGYSTDPLNPKYGTHDWIAQHALEMLPPDEQDFIIGDNALFRAFLLGTELPDNTNKSIGGIGDTTKHHVYFYADGSVQEDDAAVRAAEEYAEAVANYTAGDYYNASKTLGIVAHYIADMAVFGHVMGSDTDWGAETHHSDYEDYVKERTTESDGEFNVYLSYDGANEVSAYDAAIQLANDTTFDADGDLTCVWMDTHYNWGDPTFKDRCGESLNLAVNAVADMLHTFYMNVVVSEYTPLLLVPALLTASLVTIALVRRRKDNCRP